MAGFCATRNGRGSQIKAEKGMESARTYVEVSNSLNDSSRSLDGITGMEDTRSDEDWGKRDGEPEPGSSKQK